MYVTRFCHLIDHWHQEVVEKGLKSERKRKIVMLYLKMAKKQTKKCSFILLKNFWNMPSSLMKGIRAEIIYFIQSGNMKRHFLLPEFWIFNSMLEHSCILLHGVLKKVGKQSPCGFPEQQSTRASDNSIHVKETSNPPLNTLPLSAFCDEEAPPAVEILSVKWSLSFISWHALK